MKKLVTVVGLAVLVSSFGSVSVAKTNRTADRQQQSHFEISVPLVYGGVGALTLGAFGGMAYLFFKPVGR